MRAAIDARLSGLERCDGLEAAAVFVADRKPVQEIFDGVQPGVLEIGGAPRSDALQILQRRREHLVGGVHNVKRRISLKRHGGHVIDAVPQTGCPRVDPR